MGAEEMRMEMSLTVYALSPVRCRGMSLMCSAQGGWRCGNAVEGESYPPWRFTRSRIIAKNFSTDSPLRMKQSTFCIVGGGAPE